MRAVHSFILNGQYNWSASGMQMLADMLESYGSTTVLQWDDKGFVAEWIGRNPNELVAVCGFSLGANQIGFINTQLRQKNRHASLAVAYDPSRRSPLVALVGGQYVQRADQFDKVICYYNPSTWLYGGAKFTGPNVEVIQIEDYHLNVPYRQALHKHTVAAVHELAMKSPISA